MSIGIGGRGFLVEEDEDTAIYNYGGYNLDIPQFANPQRVCDGLIIIDKNSLVEPEIHTKIKRLPGGRKKKIIKRIVVDVPYQELVEKGKIQIENCSNSWHLLYAEKDMIAYKLLYIIFTEYQKDGFLPKSVTYNI